MDKLGKIITGWWPVIALTIGFVMAWATLQVNVANLTNRVSADEVNINSGLVAQTQIQVELSQIETDIQWIKLKLGN